MRKLGGEMHRRMLGNGHCVRPFTGPSREQRPTTSRCLSDHSNRRCHGSCRSPDRTHRRVPSPSTPVEMQRKIAHDTRAYFASKELLAQEYAGSGKPVVRSLG